MPLEIGDQTPDIHTVAPPEGSPEESELLSDPHTRCAIDYLRRTNGPVEVTDLAAHVAAELMGQPPEEIPRNVRRRVQTWFHHGQLPALAEHGIVEYDPEEGTVRAVSDGGGSIPGDG